MLTCFWVRYYEGGISSVYVWEPEDGKGFAACVLIKKGTYSDHNPSINQMQERLHEISLDNLPYPFTIHLFLVEVSQLRALVPLLHVSRVC